MNTRPNVAIFHKEQLNRKAVIKLMGWEFNFIEIEYWEDVAISKAETVIILAPELLYPNVPFDSVKEVIENLKANVIMVNNDDRQWWIFRSNYLQLRRPSEEQLRIALKTFHPEEKSKPVIFKWWKRA